MWGGDSTKEEKTQGLSRQRRFALAVLVATQIKLAACTYMCNTGTRNSSHEMGESVISFPDALILHYLEMDGASAASILYMTYSSMFAFKMPRP